MNDHPHTSAPHQEVPEDSPIRPPEEGIVHPGRAPRLRQTGRTAGILGVVVFLLLLTYLTANYSHGTPSPADQDPDAAAFPVPSNPLTADRIEEYARERLEEQRRAAKPPTSPPALDLPTAAPPIEDRRRPPAQPSLDEPPARSARPLATPRPRNLAISSPLVPNLGRTAPHDPASSTALRPTTPALPRWDELGFPPIPQTLGDTLSRLTTPEQTAASPHPLPLDERAVSRPDDELSAYHLTADLTGRSPNRLYAGTIVPLVLTHRVATDLAGPVRAMVLRDVYDSPTHERVLIPRGTLAIGHQVAHAAPGDQRILVYWRELKLPTGTSYTLPTLPAGSADGTAGALGDVDNHWWGRFGNAVALSLVGAGVQLSQPQQRTAVQGFAPDEGQLLAQQLGLELGRLSQEILRRGLDRPPTITLRPGQTLSLLLTRDLVFSH